MGESMFSLAKTLCVCCQYHLCTDTNWFRTQTGWLQSPSAQSLSTPSQQWGLLDCQQSRQFVMSTSTLLGLQCHLKRFGCEGNNSGLATLWYQLDDIMESIMLIDTTQSHPPSLDHNRKKYDASGGRRTESNFYPNNRVRIGAFTLFMLTPTRWVCPQSDACWAWAFKEDSRWCNTTLSATKILQYPELAKIRRHQALRSSPSFSDFVG